MEVWFFHHLNGYLPEGQAAIVQLPNGKSIKLPAGWKRGSYSKFMVSATAEPPIGGEFVTVGKRLYVRTLGGDAPVLGWTVPTGNPLTTEPELGVVVNFATEQEIATVLDAIDLDEKYKKAKLALPDKVVLKETVEAVLDAAKTVKAVQI